jgi:hypothetical protein
MHIVFGNITSWQTPILKLLKYIKFKVFYMYILANSDFKRNEIAEKLKKINIFPLPLEKKNLSEVSDYRCDGDPDENAYKKNMKLVPDKVLKKYCKLFSLKDGEIKKLRLSLQDVFGWKNTDSALLDIWSNIYPSKKIIYISFSFWSFYMSCKSSNIIKIIIPLDILNFFAKKILRIFLSFFSTTTNNNNLSSEKENSNNKDFKDFEKQEIAYIPHKGIFYGHPSLFEKSLYYSDNTNSNFNKYNLLHLEYSDFSSPDKNINWVCINTINVSKRKIFFKTLLFSFKTFYLIRNWSTFLGWILCIRQYSSYAKYFEIIKKFKNLKIALIDYDILCPKTLILALENNNIKTVATQERFFHPFYTSRANVIVNTYYTNSIHISNVIKKSKYYDIKNIIPVGQYRSDLLPFYKRQTVPREISKAKKNGKKILIALGFHSDKNWFDSYPSMSTSWTDQMNFLEDMIALSQKLENTFIVLRYKTIEWVKNEYFKKIFDKIHHCENIILSNNYEEGNYSYKLCAHADLIIAKATSIADECLSVGIPVLFHEYTQKTISNIPNYLPQELMCYNFEELYQKSKTILFSDHSELEEKVKKLNKTIYFVNEKKDIKKKILNDLENQLIKNKF